MASLPATTPPSANRSLVAPASANAAVAPYAALLGSTAPAATGPAAPGPFSLPDSFLPSGNTPPAAYQPAPQAAAPGNYPGTTPGTGPNGMPNDALMPPATNQGPPAANTPTANQGPTPAAAPPSGPSPSQQIDQIRAELAAATSALPPSASGAPPAANNAQPTAPAANNGQQVAPAANNNGQPPAVGPDGQPLPPSANQAPGGAFSIGRAALNFFKGFGLEGVDMVKGIIQNPIAALTSTALVTAAAFALPMLGIVTAASVTGFIAVAMGGVALIGLSRGIDDAVMDHLHGDNAKSEADFDEIGRGSFQMALAVGPFVASKYLNRGQAVVGKTRTRASRAAGAKPKAPKVTKTPATPKPVATQPAGGGAPAKPVVLGGVLPKTPAALLKWATKAEKALVAKGEDIGRNGADGGGTPNVALGAQYQDHAISLNILSDQIRGIQFHIKSGNLTTAEGASEIQGLLAHPDFAAAIAVARGL